MAPRPLIVTEHREGSPSVSPDGRWVAHRQVSDETGRNTVQVTRFPNPGSERWTWPSIRGALPTWSRDGRRLFFWREADPADSRSDGEIAAIDFDPASGPLQDDPIPVLQGIPDRETGPFAILDDDSTFLMIRKRGRNPEVILWRNFIVELKEKVGG